MDLINNNNNSIESTSNDINIPPDEMYADNRANEKIERFIYSDTAADNEIDKALEKLVDVDFQEDIEKNGKAFTESLQQSYIDMDGAFLAYLNNFNVTVQRQEYLKLQLKYKFFYYIMIFMAAVIFFPYIIVFIFRDKITDTSIVTLSITSFAEIMSAIIVLPKIIAEYLFNKKEEDNKIKVISDMQTYNKEKRHSSDKIIDPKKEE